MVQAMPADPIDDLPRDVAMILDEAAGLDDGPGKVELLQEAVRLADHARDVDAGFQARLRLMEAALVCGSADVLLVAYSWCLAQAEREPDHFGLYQVLWRYRWAIVYLPTFPEIPRSKIEDAIADMTARYRSAGASLRPVHLLRWKVAMKLGDAKMAAEARRAWGRSRRDWLTDDEQTETVTQIDYHLFRKRWSEATKLADAYIRGERQPAYLDSVLSWMPLPLLRLGRVAEAMAVHDRGYRMTTRNAALVTQAGRHLQFLALTHNIPRAIRLAERYLPYCAASDPEDKIEFYPCLLTLLSMLRRTGKETARLRLTPGCPGCQPSGRYELAELEQVYRSEATDVSRRYDIRDGNDYYARGLAELDELLDLARPYPLPRRTSGK
jgi:hypothetical protein